MIDPRCLNFFSESDLKEELEGLSFLDLISKLKPFLTDERIDRIDKVIASRSNQVVPVLENIYDKGNISAVMRSAEAFGFYDIKIIENSNHCFKNSRRVTQGAEKWLNVSEYVSAKTCVDELKLRNFKIYATDLSATKSIDEVDFTGPVAIVLGNEQDGVSPEMLDMVDERIFIPMDGFSQSFNISVAAALCFYDIHQKRKGINSEMDIRTIDKMKANYYFRSLEHAEKILKN